MSEIVPYCEHALVTRCPREDSEQSVQGRGARSCNDLTSIRFKLWDSHSLF